MSRQGIPGLIGRLQLRLNILIQYSPQLDWMHSLKLLCSFVLFLDDTKIQRNLYGFCKDDPSEYKNFIKMMECGGKVKA